MPGAVRYDRSSQAVQSPSDVVEKMPAISQGRVPSEGAVGVVGGAVCATARAGDRHNTRTQTVIDRICGTRVTTRST
jgi:hypothetical protein